jgi:hypothetical protein
MHTNLWWKEYANERKWIACIESRTETATIRPSTSSKKFEPSDRQSPVDLFSLAKLSTRSSTLVDGTGLRDASRTTASSPSPWYDAPLPFGRRHRGELSRRAPLLPAPHPLPPSPAPPHTSLCCRSPEPSPITHTATPGHLAPPNFQLCTGGLEKKAQRQCRDRFETQEKDRDEAAVFRGQHRLVHEGVVPDFLRVLYIRTLIW